MSRFLYWGIGAIFFAQSALAYTLTSTPNGKSIRWRYGQKLFLAGNSQGHDRLSADFVYQTVVNGLQQWKWATSSQFDFEYWQGNDSKIYHPKLSDDGLSSIFFASNSAEVSDPNIIGFTQIWFSNDSGDLLETDIMLNDRDYQLTDQASDTSAVRTGGWGTRPKVFLGNIVTHELGHALGLSHSGNINSSMLYVEYPEQAKLGCDDRAAARHLYATSDHTSGAITGTIVSPVGEPVSGAVVSALSKSRGIVLASVLTDQNGTFYFGSIDTGETALIVQPFQGSNYSIPVQMQSRIQTLCNNGTYPTLFVTAADGNTLQSFQVSADSLTQTGTHRLQCNDIFPASEFVRNEAGSEWIVDSAPVGTAKTYTFEAHGPFSVSGLSYLFLSSVKVDLSVTDSKGELIAVQKEAPIYQSESKFKIPDHRISGWAEGKVHVRVTPSLLSVGDYPIPSVYPGTTPYYILAFNSNGGNLMTPDARCSSPETYALYRSPSREPLRNAATSTTRDGIGFCGGTAHASTLHPARTHAHTPFGSILGWFFPFLIALGSQLYSKLRRAKLNSR